MNKLRLVLDTNVFLVSLAPQYKYHWIYESLLKGKFELCVSTEILLEYEEIICERYKIEKTDGFLNYLLLLPNIIFVNPTFKWNLIESDQDDNKFVDCFISGNADFIIGNDRHFNVLKTFDFPPTKVLKYEEFEDRYKDLFLK